MPSPEFTRTRTGVWPPAALPWACHEVADAALALISPSLDALRQTRRLHRRCAEGGQRSGRRAAPGGGLRAGAGASWDTIGDALGSITHQSVHRRFHRPADVWHTVLADPEARDSLIPYPASDLDRGAALLDRWMLEHTLEREHHGARPVSRHLERHSVLSAMAYAHRYTDWLRRHQMTHHDVDRGTPAEQ